MKVGIKMASSLIHICVAKKVNETLNMDEKQIYLGAIAPDISKLINETKIKSHFLIDEETGVPDINKFLEKYKTNLNDPFVMGYFVHLYTDKIWWEEFMPNKFLFTKVRLLDGSLVELKQKEWLHLLYNDYTNLTTQLLDYYNLDLSLFYEELKLPKNIIKEIPTEKLPLLLNDAGKIIMNSKEEKTYMLDISNIIDFINNCTERIIKSLNKMDINKNSDNI